MSFTFGTDPEFILEKNGDIVSAIGIVKGTKDRRKRVGDYAFYYDNVLAECCVPPAKTKSQAVANIGGCLKAYADLVKPCKILARASQVYDASQLKHADALLIGCTRESCAYLLEEIQPDESMFLKTNLRSAGGHVHVGSPVLLQGYNSVIAVRLLDLFLGVPALFLDGDPTSPKRKELYGKAGRFRQPDYGIEYRSLGNFWLSSPKLVEIVFDICEFVVSYMADKSNDVLWRIDAERLNSAEAWSDPNFHPSQCHVCTGYDVDALRQVLDVGKQNDSALEFLQGIVKRYLPIDLYDRIETEISHCGDKDLYKEWGIEC
jgi:hypothetical protein